MTTARFVLLIALFAPPLGWAQEAAPGAATPARSDVPSEVTLSPPPLLSAPSGKSSLDALTPEKRYPSLGARMGLQVPLVVVGALAGGVAGLGAVEVLSISDRSREDSRIALSLVGGALGAAGAVYGGGAILGMEGSFLYTLLGAGVGVALPSIGLLAGLSSFRTLNQTTAVIMLGMVGLAGPIVGYELSHSAAVSAMSARAPTTTGPRVYPLFAATSGGGSLGLAGRF